VLYELLEKSRDLLHAGNLCSVKYILADVGISSRANVSVCNQEMIDQATNIVAPVERKSLGFL